MSFTKIETVEDLQAFLQPDQALFFCDTSKKWLHFSGPVEILTASSLEEVCPLVDRVEKKVEQEGFCAAGWISYEAAPAFDSSLVVNTDTSGFPLLCFGIFPSPQPVELRFPQHSSFYKWNASITEEEYEAAIQAVKKLIAAGDTYQVNFTYRLQTALKKANMENLLALLNQPSPFFGGLISSEDWLLASGSPELFFTLDGQQITSRPMKGTAPRGLSREDDLAQAEQLRHCKKNRAENVMIVDMVRNDITRIANRGTVRVNDMFEVEKYPTLYQMTSTVQAETGKSLKTVFSALFPPASITGAPKVRTMEIIADLESTPRKVYTGTMGFLLPGRKAQFNVAIRTLLYDRRQEQVEYGVGSGIVWDSEPSREYEECKTKTKICNPPLPPFSLLETILWTPAKGYTLLEAHLQRLQRSAAYFDFHYKKENLQAALKNEEQKFSAGQQYRVRVILEKEGKLTVEHTLFTPFPSEYTAAIAFAEKPVQTDNIFLYHKTSNRAVYEKEQQLHPETDDVLLFNQHNQLTESTIANIAILSDGTLYTPPVQCGLLAGTAREQLLQSGKLVEKILPVSLLEKGYPLYLFNSVRGMYPARIIGRSCRKALTKE